ncbi:hypothetical protein BBJ28_00003483 [Nothophytophthora sp. Chile5]|nr:hypothetical protein BBJ28_00003483 [Nothophytophthora sp. Chile5]
MTTSKLLSVASRDPQQVESGDQSDEEWAHENSGFGIASGTVELVEVPRRQWARRVTLPLPPPMLVYDISLGCRVTEEFCFRIPGPLLDRHDSKGPPVALLYVLPTHLSQNLHLVLKVTKVLVGDGDSATAPYCVPDKFTSPLEQQKLVEKAADCSKRLGRFQQPLAWGTIPLTKGVRSPMTLYRQRTCVHEEQRISLIAEAIHADDMEAETDDAVLRAIYRANNQIGRSAYALVGYHQKSPQFEDEIKICLPERLTTSHHLLFTFFHVHCKKLQPNQQQQDLVGYAAIPLLGKDGTILPDNKYAVNVFPPSVAPKTATSGGIMPLPTGYAVAARDGELDAGKTFLQPFHSSGDRVGTNDTNSTDEDAVVNRLLALSQGSTATVRYFFFAITKFVLGYLRFGSSIVRWSAFRMLLAVMEKASWNPRGSLKVNEMNRVLHDFVHVVFDEGAVENPAGSATTSPTPAEYKRQCDRSVFGAILETWLNVLHNKTPIEENVDTKRMSLAYSNVLLQLILKSLAMHLVSQQGTQDAQALPIVLSKNDEVMLERVLIQLIACAGDTSNGLLLQKEVNRSVACFCRGIFLVARNAVPARVINRYMNWIDETHQDANTLVHIWFPFIRILVDFEFFPAVNGAVQSGQESSSVQARAWLARAIFDKLLSIVDTQKEEKIRGDAMRLLRRMFVAQVYNSRYQTPEEQEMIALLYYPFFPSIAQFTAHGKILAWTGDDAIACSSVAKSARELQKEMLVCVGHLLSSVSNMNLPFFFRALATDVAGPSTQNWERHHGVFLSPTETLTYYRQVLDSQKAGQTCMPVAAAPISDDSNNTSETAKDEAQVMASIAEDLLYDEVRVHACLALMQRMIEIFLIEESSTDGDFWQQLLSPDLGTCEVGLSLLEHRLAHRRSVHRRTAAGVDGSSMFAGKPNVGASNSSPDGASVTGSTNVNTAHKSLPRNWGKNLASMQQRRSSQNAGAEEQKTPRHSNVLTGLMTHKVEGADSGDHDAHIASLQRMVAFTLTRVLQTAVDQYEAVLRLIEVPVTPRLGKQLGSIGLRDASSLQAVSTNQAYALLGSLLELLFLLLQRTSCIQSLSGEPEQDNELEIDGNDGDATSDADSCFLVDLLAYLQTFLHRFSAALFAARIPELPLIHDRSRIQLLVAVASTATARHVRQQATTLLSQLLAVCYEQTGSFLLIEAPIIKVFTSIFFPLADGTNRSVQISAASLRDMLDEMRAFATTSRGSAMTLPLSFHIQFIDLLNSLTAKIHAYERWRDALASPEGAHDFEEIEEGLDRVIESISPHWLVEEKLIWLDAMLRLHVRRDRFAEAACCKLEAIECVRRVSSANDGQLPPNHRGVQQWSVRQLLTARDFAQKADWIEQELAITEGLLVCLRLQRRYAEYQETLRSIDPLITRLAERQESSSRRSSSAFSFYRVRYAGGCVSARIAKDEYIYKRNKFTSLGEFVGEVKAMLRANYPQCERVDVVPEPKPLVGTEDHPNVIFVRVTTVEEASAEELLSWQTRVSCAPDWQVAFKCALPFTFGNSSSYGKTSEQMKRITYLSVARPFPCRLNRQRVLLRHEETRCPIDNSMDDIRKRCVLLRAEIDKERFGKTDLKTLTLVLKGSVDTHVHGGVPEVLDSFLAAEPPRLVDAQGRIMSRDDSLQRQHELTNLLVEFVQLCWRCLLISREAFRRSSQPGSSPAPPSHPPSPLHSDTLPHHIEHDQVHDKESRSFLPPGLSSSIAIRNHSKVPVAVAPSSSATESSSPVVEVSPLQTEFERSFAALVDQMVTKIPFAHQSAAELAQLHQETARLRAGSSSPSPSPPAGSPSTNLPPPQHAAGPGVAFASSSSS